MPEVMHDLTCVNPECTREGKVLVDQMTEIIAGMAAQICRACGENLRISYGQAPRISSGKSISQPNRRPVLEIQIGKMRLQVAGVTALVVHGHPPGTPCPAEKTKN